MRPATEPLRVEHRELYPHIDAIRSAADSIGNTPATTMRRNVNAVCAFLTDHLLPHAKAEEEALYPVVGKILGSPRATATMSRDHREIARLTQELRDLRNKIGAGPMAKPLALEFRRILYGLDALIRLHFAKEEEVYLPLLDHQLKPEEVTKMFEAMERTASRAKESGTADE